MSRAQRSSAEPRCEIRRYYIRRYSDNGQTVAYVEWSDGSRTEGSPLNWHMRALMDRADDLNAPFEYQCW